MRPTTVIHPKRRPRFGALVAFLTLLPAVLGVAMAVWIGDAVWTWTMGGMVVYAGVLQVVAIRLGWWA